MQIFTDGASRGNPGPSGVGAVILSASTGESLASVHHYIGEATNNVAEYYGLMFGLAKANDLGAKRVMAFMDSQLVVNQVLGEWAVKHPGLKPMCIYVRELLTYFDEWSIKYIPREENVDADALANLAIDTEMSKSIGKA